MSKENVSFYYLLGVPEDATTSEIKQAYLNWMQKLSAYVEGLPDGDKKRENAAGIAQMLTEIYQILSDEDLRAQYDASRAQGNEMLFRDNNNICYRNGIPFDLSDFMGKGKGEATGSKNNTGNSTTIIPVNNGKGSNHSSKGTSIIPTKPSTVVPQGYTPVVHIDDSDDAKKTSRKGKNAIKAIALTTAIALVVGTLGYWLGMTRNNKQKGEGISTSTSDTSNTSSTTDTSKPIESTTTSSSTTSEPEIVDPIVNFGDAKDPIVVNAKVDEISELINKLGIIDPQTMKEYNKEDLKNIILFINGALIPETDEQAYALVNQQLDLTCQLLSTPRVVNFINHMAGNTAITDEMIQEDIDNGTDLSLVKSMLLGDSYGYEYLEYLESAYNELLNTNDKDLFVKKYTAVVNTLANLVYGKSIIVNNKEYTIRDFCGLDNLNDGNILNMYANMLSVLNVDGVEQFITVKGRDGENVTVSLEELFSNFDLICVTDNLDIDDDGKIVGNVDNFQQRLQVDTINTAIENRYHGNLNAYDYNYNKSLR